MLPPYSEGFLGPRRLATPANAGGEPKPAPLETAPSEWNVERKVVVFTLLRERRSCERLNVRLRTF
jgi:hypothetical protein